MSKIIIEDPNLQNSKDSEKVEYSVSASWDYIKEFIFGVLDLEHGIDKKGTIEEISNKKSMEGANAWMLICSIIIASIGLSQNSQAVIIGAMLISPLMSPLLGIGLSIGINDMETLRKALFNLLVAIVIALLTSTSYFFLMDFVDITSEIQARTRPTFLDIIVAVFGGLAGIISIARKDVTTTLPGVAIATALMPPLCVTGFGLANGNFDIASRSFYLFFLNTFFVALSTYLIVRLLKFPYKEHITRGSQYRNMRIIVLFSILLMIPSFLIFKGVLRDLNRDQNLSAFKSSCLGSDLIYLDSYQYIYQNDGNDRLFLKVYGNIINEEKIGEYQECLSTLGMENVDIFILPSTDVDLNQITAIETNLKDISAQLVAINAAKRNQEELVTKYAISYIDSLDFLHICTELKTLFPEIKEIGLAKMHNTDFANYNSNLTTIMVSWGRISNQLKLSQNDKIHDFIQLRLNLDTLRLVEL